MTSETPPTPPPLYQPKVTIKVAKMLGPMRAAAERYNGFAYIDGDIVSPVHFTLDVPTSVPEESRLKEAKRILADLTLSIANAAAAQK